MIIIQMRGIRYYLVCLRAMLIASITSCSSMRFTNYIGPGPIDPTGSTPYAKIAAIPPIDAKSDITPIRQKPNKPRKPYILRKRVGRWMDNIEHTEDIKDFKDNGKKLYANLPDDTLWFLHSNHDMEGMTNLLNYLESIEDIDNYFTNTKRGMECTASLILTDKQKAKELHPYGMVKIGIETKASNKMIYHMMFHKNPQRPTQYFHPKSGQPVKQSASNNKEACTHNKIEVDTSIKAAECITSNKDQDKIISQQRNNYIRENKQYISSNKAKGYDIFKKRDDYIIERTPRPKDSPYALQRVYIHPKIKRTNCTSPYSHKASCSGSIAIL